MKTVWVATANQHKVEEIMQILGTDYKVCSLLDIENFPEIDENGKSYSENALIKAKALWEKVKQPVFSDDSGLEVDALDGKPGIHSARFSGDNATHAKNIDKLLSELAGIEDTKRTARFRCIMVLLDHNGEKHEFTGTLEGMITHERHGEKGFGYDPVFFLPEKGCTVAELSSKEKNLISHRSRALNKLKTHLDNAIAHS